MLGGLGFSNAAASRARLSTLAGERYATERHRQHQHDSGDQQRNALPHLFSPPLPSRQRENRPTPAREIAGCATGSTRPTYSAHLWGSGLLSFYLELADFLCSDVMRPNALTNTR
jgi:hypothetical protein